MNELNQIVSEHPAIVVLAFTLFFGATNVALGAAYRALKWFVYREFEKLEHHEDQQDVAIRKLEERLDRYDVKFAVSQTSFDQLVGKIDEHMRQEEETLKTVGEIRDRLANLEGMIRRSNGITRKR